MAFGMGCCCLQVTFQARNLTEARHLYDQLAVLAPIFMALTAASPFFRGHLADTDVRWAIISQSVDDRTPQERGAQAIDADAAARGVQVRPQGHCVVSLTKILHKEQAVTYRQIFFAFAYNQFSLHFCRAAACFQRIAKSRYDSISCYLSELPAHKPAYNDVEVEIDTSSFERLRCGGLQQQVFSSFHYLD